MEKEDVDYRVSVENTFRQFRNSKVLVYGTGEIASKLLRAMGNFSVIGVLDRDKSEGVLEGYPIISWEDECVKEADVVIVAASTHYYYEIFHRIKDKCDLLGLEIWGANGRNLRDMYASLYGYEKDEAYYAKNKKNLMNIINDYDAISFDLFDTILMRKVLKPQDVLDIVEYRIQEQGINFTDFKRLRIAEDKKQPNGTIYDFYEAIKWDAGLTDEEKNIILQTEIKCEQDVLIPRQEMLEVMRMAYASGKKVNIVSDMYLPSDILKNILNKLNIVEYDKIYVSCEYGARKSNGLFEIYKNEVRAEKYLHIGDNLLADYESAIRYGIDAYSIKSAIDMMFISNLNCLFKECNTLQTNIFMGILLSQIFNSPFALNDTEGLVHINTFEQVGQIFGASLSICYLSKLITQINQDNSLYEIIFGSRDGFLPLLMYNMVPEKFFVHSIKPKGYYLYTSRKLMMRAAKDSVDLLNLCKFYKIERDNTSYRYNVYKQYIQKSNIDCDKQYRYCELYSQGTIQFLLQDFFHTKLMGFYLCKYKKTIDLDIDYYTIFPQDINGMASNSIVANNTLLETILTSSEPSVDDIDKDGKIIFSVESRSQEEIEIMERIHKEIIFFYQQFLDLAVPGEFNENLVEKIWAMSEIYVYEEEALKIKKMKFYDEFNNKFVQILN